MALGTWAVGLNLLFSGSPMGALDQLLCHAGASTMRTTTVVPTVMTSNVSMLSRCALTGNPSRPSLPG